MSLTPIEIAQLKAENAAIDAEIAKLELRKLTIAQELSPTECVEPEQDLQKVQWVNTDNLNAVHPSPVVVHGAGCQHLSRIYLEPAVQAGLTEISNVEQWRTAESFCKDYNADFHAEDGLDGCWDITFYPCTGLVSKTTTMTGFDS